MAEDPAKKYFSPKVTDRDRAVFEAGIALGMVIHQFTGIPIKFVEEIEHLKKVIEYAIRSQPFKIDADVRISIDIPQGVENPYRYETLKSRHLDITITTKYGKAKVRARLRYVPELDYTLAYIEDVEEEDV